VFNIPAVVVAEQNNFERERLARGAVHELQGAFLFDFVAEGAAALRPPTPADPPFFTAGLLPLVPLVL
jgi:hypothetical protein